MSENIIPARVRGNDLPCAIPLQVINTADPSPEPTDFFPAEGDTVRVRLVGKRQYTFTPEIVENVLLFTIPASVAADTYGCEVVIIRAEGEPKTMRSYNADVIRLVETNEEANLAEGVELEVGGEQLEGALFSVALLEYTAGTGIVISDGRVISADFDVVAKKNGDASEAFKVSELDFDAQPLRGWRILKDGDTLKIVHAKAVGEPIVYTFTQSKSGEVAVASDIPDVSRLAKKNGDVTEPFNASKLGVGDGSIGSLLQPIWVISPDSGNNLKLDTSQSMLGGYTFNVEKAGEVAVTSETAKKTLVIHVTESGGTYTADKTFAEVYAAGYDWQNVELAFNYQTFYINAFYENEILFVGWDFTQATQRLQVFFFRSDESLSYGYADLLAGSSLKTINGASLVGSGNIAVATPTDLAGKADILTEQSVAAASDIMLACVSGKYYIIGAVTNLTLSFTAPTQGIGVYGGKFTAASASTALTLPLGVTADSGSPTSFEANEVYEWNMIDNVIIIRKL